MTAILLRDSRSGLNSYVLPSEGKIYATTAKSARTRLFEIIDAGIADPFAGTKIMLVQLLRKPNHDFDGNNTIASFQSSHPHLIDHVRTGRSIDCDLNPESLVIDDYLEANRGWFVAKGAIVSGLYSTVLIDKLDFALALELVDIDDIIKTFKKKPPHVEIILTGHDYPSGLLTAGLEIR